MDIALEKMKDEDWPAVVAIYREGIDTGDATFEADIPTWEQFDGRHLRDCRLVARVGGTVVGWAALSAVSSRCVYTGVAEVSVYVKASMRGQGMGKTLLTETVKESERVGFWTLQAGIFPENTASLALHKACGFRVVGFRERLGQMNGLWRDVVLLERRSKVVGI
jgi:L-amino acid N-acyltransferase YncA